MELVLIDLDHPQTVVIILVEQRLDTRGFPRPGITIEQNVIGGLAAQERFGIAHQLLLLQLIAHKV